MPFILSVLMLTILVLSAQIKENDNQRIKNQIPCEEVRSWNESLKKSLDNQNFRIQRLKEELIYLRTEIDDKTYSFYKYMEDTVPQTGIQILRTGKFHANEVNKEMENLMWFGLMKWEDGYWLKKVKINIDKVKDHLVDQDGIPTGKKISLENHQTPVVLITGLDNLQERLISSVNLPQQYLYPGENMRISLNGIHYTFSAYGSIKPEQEDVHSYLLQVRMLQNNDNSKKQFIGGTARFNNLSSETFSFIWAGDLDGDGFLDLLMDSSDHYNVTHYTLFLSSMANENEIIKKVAVFINVGC